MIYTIFFRKLQKKFGVAIQTMGYPGSQKVYTPHLGIEKVQTVNDTHSKNKCENEKDNKNENKNENENENENENYNASIGCEIVYSKAQIILGIKHQASMPPVCIPVAPFVGYFSPSDSIYQVWVL